MATTSNKQGISDLVKIFEKEGIDTIIISPGSRNAPLTIAFSENPSFTCLSIPDERSAAFYALGIAQQKRSPVALVCTSGSAVLNYSPAVAEAYYQQVPLIVISADRPEEWVDQSDGQTIRQRDVFYNFIRGSYQLPQEASGPDDLWYNKRIISEAIMKTQSPVLGPVHINIPLREPLYDTNEVDTSSLSPIKTAFTRSVLNDDSLKKMEEQWLAAEKKLVIVGMNSPDPVLNELLIELSTDPSVAILTETTSNLIHESFNSSIDNILFTITENEVKDFQPDLLLTFGGQVVSKKIKAFLRIHKPSLHWHVSHENSFVDTYKSLTEVIPIDTKDLLETIVSWDKKDSAYSAIWKSRDLRSHQRRVSYLKSVEWSDLKVFETLLDYLPDESQLQWGNSTPVRYSQLFKFEKKYFHFANRGTSGIDGSVSTAAGAAIACPDDWVTAICGDMSFFYDSNALWNNHLSPNLRIVLINNSGGGIFRMIPGPDTTNALEPFFEAKHKTSAESIAAAFGVDYLSCYNELGMRESLSDFFNSTGKPAILEIFTPNEKNAEVIRNYFKFLNDDDGNSSYDESEKLDYYKGVPGYQI